MKLPITLLLRGAHLGDVAIHVKENGAATVTSIAYNDGYLTPQTKGVV